MNRGISFKIAGTKGKVLCEILKCIGIKRYYWYSINSQAEVWTDYDGEEFLLQNSYSGDDFYNLIQMDLFIVFLKLLAYYENDFTNDIHSYDDFVCSNCKLMLLIYDCEYVEIYAKELTVIDAIYMNAKNKGFSDLQYITDKNDNRKRMDIL